MKWKRQSKDCRFFLFQVFEYYMPILPAETLELLFHLGNIHAEHTKFPIAGRLRSRHIPA